jgi:hypothetical protein
MRNRELDDKNVQRLLNSPRNQPNQNWAKCPQSERKFVKISRCTPTSHYEGPWPGSEDYESDGNEPFSATPLYS